MDDATRDKHSRDIALNTDFGGSKNGYEKHQKRVVDKTSNTHPKMEQKGHTFSKMEQRSLRSAMNKQSCLELIFGDQ